MHQSNIALLKVTHQINNLFNCSSFFNYSTLILWFVGLVETAYFCKVVNLPGLIFPDVIVLGILLAWDYLQLFGPVTRPWVSLAFQTWWCSGRKCAAVRGVWQWRGHWTILLSKWELVSCTCCQYTQVWAPTEPCVCGGLAPLAAKPQSSVLRGIDEHSGCTALLAFRTTHSLRGCELCASNQAWNSL